VIGLARVWWPRGPAMRANPGRRRRSRRLVVLPLHVAFFGDSTVRWRRQIVVPGWITCPGDGRFGLQPPLVGRETRRQLGNLQRRGAPVAVASMAACGNQPSCDQCFEA